MAAKRKFSKHFREHACEGDTRTIELKGGMIAVATIYRDDCRDKPDERQDGFWPSLDPKDAGYIGPKSEATLARETKRAKDIMRAWKNDEWFYCGIAVQIWKDEDTPLTGKYANALWGIECNYPARGNRRPNAYLLEVANELLGEALTQAEALTSS